MGIEFTKTFGNIASKNVARTDDRLKAQFWLNIGYSSMVDVEAEGQDTRTESRFISLPMGIALDTQDKLKSNSSNAIFAAFQEARNDLLDQIMEVCKTLEPGEEKIIGEAGGLQLQVRRVSVKTEVEKADNAFIKKLSLVA